MYVPEKAKEAIQKIQENILSGLKSGAIWSCPWTAAGTPVNAFTNRPYDGMNKFTLALRSAIKGWGDHRFVTARQVAREGGQLSEDAQGTPVIYNEPWIRTEKPFDVPGGKPKTWFRLREWKDLTESMDVLDLEDYKAKKVFITRVSFVYPIHQTNLEFPPLPEALVHPPGEIRPELETILNYVDAAVPIVYGGDRAAYVYVVGDESGSHILLPNRGTFRSTDDFYRTFSHEACHAGDHRMNKAVFEGDRDAPGRRAVRELVAEIGAMDVCMSNGIPYTPQHASYIEGWASEIDALPEKKRLSYLMFAFSGATKAAQWVKNGGSEVLAHAMEDVGQNADDLSDVEYSPEKDVFIEIPESETSREEKPKAPVPF